MQKLIALFRALSKRLVLTLGITLTIVLLPSALAFTFLLSARGNEWLRYHLQHYLEEKLNTRITIGQIHFRRINHLTISGLMVSDQTNHTLLSIKTLSLYLNWGYWLQSEPSLITSTRIERLDGSIKREAATKRFNYQFILDAFSSENQHASGQTASIGWIIPQTLQLHNCRFDFNDKVNGQRASIICLKLDSKLRLQNEIIPANLIIETTKLDSVVVDAFVSADKPPTLDESQSDPWTGKVRLTDFQLYRSAIHFENRSGGQAIETNIGHLQVSNGNFIFAKPEISIGRIQIDDHVTTLRSEKSKNAPSSPENTFLELAIDTVVLKQNRFVLNAGNHKLSQSVKFAPLNNDFKNINLTATNLSYSKEFTGGRLVHMSFEDHSKFRLLNLSTELSMDSKTTRFKNLSLLTPKNSIYGNIEWHYPSIQQAIRNPETSRLIVTVNKSVVNLRELVYFIPVLRDYHNIYPLYEQRIRTSFQLSGVPRELLLKQFDIATSQNYLSGSGKILVPALGKSMVILDIKKGWTSRAGLLDIITKNTLSPAILERIPKKIRLRSQLNINSGTLQGELRTTSSLGVLGLNGKLSGYSDLNRIKYDLGFNTRDFNLAPILKDTLWGKVTASGKFRGTGLGDPLQMVLNTEGFAENISIYNQSFKSILFDARLEKGRLAANLASSYPDLHIELSPTIYLLNPDSLMRISGVVHHADMRKLGLSKDSLVVAGAIAADLLKLTTDSLIGELKLSDVRMQYKGTTHDLKHVNIHATKSDDKQILQLTSPWANLDLTGKYQIRQVPYFAKNLFKSLLFGDFFTENKGVDSYQMDGNINVPVDMLPLIPGLSALSPFNISSNYHHGAFDFHTMIDNINMNGVAIDSSFIGIEAYINPLLPLGSKYRIGAKSVGSKSFSFRQTLLNGSMVSGLHSAILSTSQNDGQIRVPFTYDPRLKNPLIFLGDSLNFLGETWTTNPENAIYPLADNFAGSHLMLKSKSKSALFEASGAETRGLPYKVSLNNIDLKPISSLLRIDTTLLTGRANGTISVTDLQPVAMTAHMDIHQLRSKEVSLGELNLDITSDSLDQYSLRMDLHNQRQLVSSSGTYNRSTGRLNVTTDLSSLPVTLLSTFTGDNIDSLRGSLSGRLMLSTTDENKVAVHGLISVDSTIFAVRETGALVQIAHGKLTLDKDKVKVDSVHIGDSASGKAILTGSVDIQDILKPVYRLKLKATNFRAIDVLRNNDQLVYGNGQTNANLDLSGNSGKFQLTGQVSLSDSARIYYRNAANSRPNFGEGLLEFTSLDPAENSQQLSSTVQGLINTNISIPEMARLTLLLDEYRGEKIVVQGKSKLNYARHAGGEMQLNGKYEVASGTYTFTVGENIRKEFTLENGGTIQWMGDLDQPFCDLTAIYKVNTSAGALMQGTDADAGRRKFDFLVKLKLKGNLSKPDVSFEIGMKDTDQDAFNGSVYSKIKEINSSQSEVTKQVMSLLVLNSFMGDSPFGSLTQFSSTAMEAGAYNTIGNLLTRQLNNMLAGMVKVVDITLGMNWSESVSQGRSSTRSDIKVGIGKSLFNHRLNLYVGNNFGIETASGNNNGFSGLANDVSVEYLLNAQGKYRIKGYHVRDNELTLHGSHMETGVEFTIVWEFDPSKAKNVKKKTAL